MYRFSIQSDEVREPSETFHDQPVTLLTSGVRRKMPRHGIIQAKLVEQMSQRARDERFQLRRRRPYLIR